MITNDEVDQIEEELYLEDMGNKKEVREVMEQFELAGYKPELVTDDSDFQPIKGKYVCSIIDIGKKEGTSNRTGQDYSFYFIKLQVNETIEGDKANNRRLDKAYGDKLNADKTVVKTALKVLADDLHTAGLAFVTTSEDDFHNSLQALRDKSVNVKAWEWNREKQGKDNLQMIKIVKEFKVSKKKTSGAPF